MPTTGLIDFRIQCHSKGGTDGGTGVSNTEGIVRAFFAIWEGREASFFADGGELFTTPSQDFVRVGLMTNIPNQLVKGCVHTEM